MHPASRYCQPNFAELELGIKRKICTNFNWNFRLCRLLSIKFKLLKLHSTITKQQKWNSASSVRNFLGRIGNFTKLHKNYNVHFWSLRVAVDGRCNVASTSNNTGPAGPCNQTMETVLHNQAAAAALPSRPTTTIFRQNSAEHSKYLVIKFGLSL